MTEESVSYSSGDSPGPAVLSHRDKQLLGDNCSVKASCNTRLLRKAQRLLGQQEGWGHFFSSVQSLSRVRLSVTPWTAAHQASLSITNSWSLPKHMSIESVMPSNHLILCCPLLLAPSIPPSIRVFSNESSLRTKWPEYWSFSFSSSPSNEHPGLISFRMYWLDLLAVQGTLKSLLQHHSSKASVLWCSAFFIVQLSHPLLRNTVTRLLLGAWQIRPEGRLLKSPVSLAFVQRGADVFAIRGRHGGLREHSVGASWDGPGSSRETPCSGRLSSHLSPISGQRLLPRGPRRWKVSDGSQAPS